MIRLTLGDILYHERVNDTTPAGHLPLRSLPLLVLVGMTGAGKTTTIRALLRSDPSVGLLPERRDLADEIIIPAMLAGAPGSTAPADRIGRMALTRRFREMHPGGFAHILANLSVAVLPGVTSYVFDGLRGPEEVGHALAHLPRAAFAVFDIADDERLRRLLERKDRFDTLEPAAGGGGAATDPWEGAGFSREEREKLLAAVPPGHDPAEVRDKIRIIAEERRNYRMAEVAALADSGEGGPRMLLIRDSDLRPEALAAMITTWWPTLHAGASEGPTA